MKSLIVVLLSVVTFSAVAGELNVGELVCEYQVNPLGIDVAVPRFSWQLHSAQRSVLQASYELRVGLDSAFQTLVWQSGHVASSQSVNVPYHGPSLVSRQRYFWQVRVSDNYGKVSAWSEVQWWEMGLLAPVDWKAEWICSDSGEDTLLGPATMLRKTYHLTKAVKSARLYVTSHGVYEASINGSRVGNDCLTPGWTSYKTRLQYQVYDVTSQLVAGENAIGVMIGDGWYLGPLGWSGLVRGVPRALLLQLEVVYTDGSRDCIVSDGNWKSSVGPVRMSSIYYGETYDARLEKSGWTSPTYADTAWTGTRVLQAPRGSLIAACSPPIRKHEVFHPVKITKTKEGETIVDFGQNLVGWVQLRVNGNAGEKVTIRHGEVLDRNGNLYTENLRVAKQTIQYTLKGGGEEVFEPHFSFFGFRYVSVAGYPGELTAGSLTATALYSDLQRTGMFSCSHPLINQLVHNIEWGQKGNFLDVPTDCPQRDERLGWTGDAEAFSATAALNMDVAPFFTKWLRDLAADQLSSGAVPHVIPNVLDTNGAASAGWADAATIIPWNMYLAYGDKRILEQQYASMKAWVDYMAGKSREHLWNTGYHFGDWLFYSEWDDASGVSAVTDKYLIAQAFFVHSTDLLIRSAKVLNKSGDTKRYTKLLEQAKTAFLKEYVTPNGALVSGTQTAYVLALDFDLLPEAMRDQAAKRLVENIQRYDYHLTTGFLGTPHLCQVLSRFGYANIADTLLMREKYPSWLYPVTMGATTIWERWDGIRPDSTFQTPGMNSFNHYAYGAIGEYLYRVVGGINTDPSAPGYKRILIAPKSGGKLTNASAQFLSMYGPIRSSWKIVGDTATISVSIPANTTAEVTLPGAASKLVNAEGVNVPRKQNPKAIEGKDLHVAVGSGDYSFTYVLK